MKTNEKQTKTNTKTNKKTEEKEMNKKANANTNTTNNAGMDEILAALLAQQRVLNEQIARFAQMLGNTEDEQTEAVEVAEKQEKTAKKTTTKKTTTKTATKKSGKKSAKGEIEGAKIVTFTDNAGNERIAVCFDEKPSAAVRDALKKQGHFRFYAKTDNPNVKNAWVRKDSESARTALAKIAEAV